MGNNITDEPIMTIDFFDINEIMQFETYISKKVKFLTNKLESGKAKFYQSELESCMKLHVRLLDILDKERVKFYSKLVLNYPVSL